MGKRRYRAVDVKRIDRERLVEGFGGERVVAGVDVAKEVPFCAFVDEERCVHQTVKWKQPGETMGFIDLLEEFRESGCRVEVVMESTGTYGDSLRHQLECAEFPVFQASGKRTHDAREVYDGVDSLHDAKSAYVVSRLHLEGSTRPWLNKSDEEREMRALVRVVDRHDDC
jgi:hypothetical protein